MTSKDSLYVAETEVIKYRKLTSKRISKGDMGAGESRQGTRPDQPHQDPTAEEEIAAAVN